MSDWIRCIEVHPAGGPGLSSVCVPTGLPWPLVLCVPDTEVECHETSIISDLGRMLMLSAVDSHSDVDPRLKCVVIDVNRYFGLVRVLTSMGQQLVRVSLSDLMVGDNT